VAVKLPLSVVDWSRSIAGTPDINLTNRYFEQDPTNTENQSALLTRPGLEMWLELPTLPVRALYSQPGSFGDALFAVSGNGVYKILPDETFAAIGYLNTTSGFVSMAATDTYLFLADGSDLWSYTENDYARSVLTTTGAISAAQTVVIGDFTYKFVATDVTPFADGSSGAPWLVLMGGSTTETLQNLFDAIGNTGQGGISYSLAMVPNPDVVPTAAFDTNITIRAASPGTDGNSIVTTETLANGSWEGATLAGGGGTTFATVPVPDDDGIISVGVILSFTICVVAQGSDPAKNGRFYWIWPGENTIQDLDFATAERSPDTAYSVNVLGDQFWLPGASSIEVWNPTGDGDAPFERQLGRLFERGAWAGTVLNLGEAMMLVDATGMPWEVTDSPQPIGTPGVVERVREAINTQRAA
jgi:hypothetical protein